MDNTNTEASFGTLGSAMRCAYLLANGFEEWQGNRDGTPA